MPNNIVDPQYQANVRAYNHGIKERLESNQTAAQIQDDPDLQQLAEVIMSMFNLVRHKIRYDANKINSSLRNRQRGRKFHPTLLDLLDRDDFKQLSRDIKDFGVANLDPTTLSLESQRRVTLAELNRMSKAVTGWVRSLRRQGLVDYADNLEIVMGGIFKMGLTVVEQRFSGTHGKP
jgi:hypothetical protein